MRTRLPVLLAGVALAACGGSTTPDPSIELSFPTAVAVFHGYTEKDPAERRPYLAIANGGRGDLSLVDAVDDDPVMSSILIRPLAVPTLPVPSLLVGASLADGGADLLAVAGAGGSVVQIVETWSPANRVVLEVDLAADAPGAQILSMIGAPLPELSGDPAAWGPAPGRTRLVAGLTGGRLAVLEFARDEASGGVTLSGWTTQDVGFDPVSLTTAPDVVHLYAATPDDLPAGSGVYGVVELDASGTPGAWSTAMLPTRAPTRLVAAWRLMERALGEADIFEPFEVDRVYAALDPSGCGGSRQIDCGIVVVDPSPAVRGLLPDPLGEMPYLPPIRIPGQAVALAVGPPPERPPSNRPEDIGYAKPFMKVIPTTGVRETTGVMAVPSTLGRVYYVDLGRRTVLNDRTMLRPTGGAETRTRADGFLPQGPSGTEQILLVVACDDEGACEPSRDATTILEAIQVTPGYTYDDTWALVYQGVLPGLGARIAETGSTGGRVWVAAQARDVLGQGFIDVARLYDPALGVHIGDVVELTSAGIAECATTLEATVEDFAVPDLARYPGGAVYLSVDPADTAGQACLARLGAGATGLGLWVRAGDYLLSAGAAGYAGRGEVVQTSPDLRVRARLQYENEDALSCPLSPWPVRPDLVDCLGACREGCERLALARKSRRIHNVADSCDATIPDLVRQCTDIWKDLPLPDATGPVVALEVAHRWLDPTREGLPPAPPERDLGVAFQTAAGIWPTSRSPLSGAPVLPTGVVAFDRSPHVQADGTRFFVSYSGDFVFDFSPSQPVSVGTTIH